MTLFLCLLCTTIICRIIFSSEDLIIVDLDSQNPEFGALFSTPKPSIELPPDDCLILSLEYLSRYKDLKSFRGSSKHFEEIYQRYKLHQTRKFHALDLLFNCSHRDCRQFRSITELLVSVPCIPFVYIDPNNSQSIDTLSRNQHRAKLEIVRGLTTGLNQPFLSLCFWNAKQPRNSLFLICIFDINGTVHDLVIKYHHFTNRHSIRLGQCIGESSARDFIDVLDSGYLGTGKRTWYLDKQHCIQCAVCLREAEHRERSLNGQFETRNCKCQKFDFFLALFMSLCVGFCFLLVMMAAV